MPVKTHPSCANLVAARVYTRRPLLLVFTIRIGYKTKNEAPPPPSPPRTSAHGYDDDDDDGCCYWISNLETSTTCIMYKYTV